MWPVNSLNAELWEKTPVFGLRVWVVIGISVGVLIVFILSILSVWVTSRQKSSRSFDELPVSQIPSVSKEITVDRVGPQSVAQTPHEHRTHCFSSYDSDKTMMSSDADNMSQCSSIHHNDRDASSYSGDEGSSGHARRPHSPYSLVSASPLIGLPEFSHLGWGHWFTLRDLENATDRFSKENVTGEGGYGVVYRGRLVNGTEVAVKRLLNNLGQAEKEFRAEAEAIGHVRHKNLVRLLGYCIEGTHRMLVYEYVTNGNLEQWLHGALQQHGVLSWENRMKVIVGTAKGLAYLHEAVEPKVVHRDIKSSNILIDAEYNAKISDFGLAKLLGSGKSHLTTRVMGTFGCIDVFFSVPYLDPKNNPYLKLSSHFRYVAPEYANTGLVNEKSDVYSFGVLLLETVSGREPIDHGRPANEVNLVEWLKQMVGNRRTEEVVDPNLEAKPSTRALKRALLVALRCVDPDSSKRPNMGQVVRMLEADEDRQSRRSHSRNMEIESLKKSNSLSD
ncbi:probable receptor-like protein kinase At2g42960 [Musa acuminata AAA Group]|uniref:probable receptor-like protein kinase At2g42960 n=1 Tax=Musa acuminata AAA Group TaxID=214697 RepID=UPI0031DA6C29